MKKENNLSVLFATIVVIVLYLLLLLSQDILSTNDVKYAIDKIIDVNPNTLILTGEPFIRKDILEIISLYKN